MPNPEAEKQLKSFEEWVTFISRMVISIPIVGLGGQFPNFYLRRRD